MGENDRAGWDRRDVLGGAALLALALGLPLAAIRFGGDGAPSTRQRQLMREVSQLVIPQTDTPGGGDAAVGDFVILALDHGLERSRQPLPAKADPQLVRHRRGDGSLDHVGWLEAELDRRGGGDFLALDPASREAALAALDAEAFAKEVKDHPWRTVKGLILTGYYTSEIGGSRELRYELVPGRFDPDLPVTAQTRAWSSDWTAVDFG